VGRHPSRPRVRHLAGSYDEIGRALGAGLDWSAVLAEVVGNQELAAECEALVERVYPPAVAKFRGIVEALGVRAEALRPWYFVRGAMIGCTTFALEQGESLVGRAYHWFHEAAKWCEARRVEPRGDRAYMGYTHNAVGVSDGMNEAGLCAFLSALSPMPARQPGLPWHAAMDWVLGSTATVEDAAELLTGIPHVRPFIYFLADASGGLAAVEAFPDGTHVRRPEGGLLVTTNYSVARQIPDRHRERQSGAEAVIGGRAGPLTAADARALIGGHDGPFCAGKHVEPTEEFGDQDWYTLWGLVAEPARRRISLAPGQPCRTPWFELRFPGDPEGMPPCH